MRFFLFVSFLLLTATTQAQPVKTIRGTVTDAATNEGLPSANLLIEGTRSGTVTNVDGAYELALPSLPATILVRYIGYQSQRITITASTPARLDVALAPVPFELDELIVSDEDPAPNIMRKVIERKQERQATLRTWQAQAYTRFTISNDAGIVAITESVTRAYWDRERGMREVAEAKRQTANLDFDTFMPAASTVMNFYADDINVAGFRAIGPTHPDALRHYHFRLKDRRYLDDQLVYVIEITPRNKLQPGFKGTVAVLDEAYALLEVDLLPNEAILYPPPISNFTHAFRQQFSDFGQDVWLPVDFRYEGRLAVKLPGLRFPGIRFLQTSRLTDYEINIPLPDSLYEQKRLLTVDSVAVAQARRLDEAGVSVPLSEQEQAAYAGLDSTASLAKAFQPTGPLARFVNMEGESDEDGGSVSVRAGAQNGGGMGLNFGITPRLWFNRVEGLHAGARASVAPRNSFFSLYGEAGYSSEDAGDPGGHWSWGGGLNVRFGANDAVRLGASAYLGVVPRYESAHYPQWMTGLATVLGFSDYFDYYQTHTYRVEAAYRFRSFDGEATLGYRFDDAGSVSKATEYDLFGSDRTLRENPWLGDGFHLQTFSLDVTLGGGEDFALTGDKGLKFSAEYGAHEYDSGDVVYPADGYIRLSGTLTWRFPTFLQRRLLPNVLDVKVTGGTSFGDLPMTRPLIVEGTMAGYSPFGTLRTQRGVPYEGEHAAALFWEHNFRTVPFELLGLRGLAENGWGLALHGAHAKTWLEDDTQRRWVRRDYNGTVVFPFTPNGTPESGHHELGLSLHGIGGFVRLDGTVRLDKPGFFFSFGIARIF